MTRVFDSLEMTIKELREIPDLSLSLAERFPHPQDVRAGIHELLVNAIEHGNLGLGFTTKRELLMQGKWENEIERRMALPENKEKRVFVRVQSDDNECRLEIEDQGSGFLWEEQIQNIAQGTPPNGRGLLIALNSNFDHMSFNSVGNCVTCISKRS